MEERAAFGMLRLAESLEYRGRFGHRAGDDFVNGLVGLVRRERRAAVDSCAPSSSLPKQAALPPRNNSCA
jgi:hypothetical protein